MPLLLVDSLLALFLTAKGKKTNSVVPEQLKIIDSTQIFADDADKIKNKTKIVTVSADGEIIEKRGIWGCETPPYTPFFGFISPRLSSYRKSTSSFGITQDASA